MADYVPTKYQKSAFGADGDLLIRKRLLPKKVKSALQYSIAKWIVICELLEQDVDIRYNGGERTCALCCALENCENCPITLEDILHEGCDYTPYTSFHSVNSTRIRLKAAQLEVEFLQRIYEWWLNK